MTPVIASVRSYLAEPAVPNPPPPSRLDAAMILVISIVAGLEAALRTDSAWTGVGAGWRITAVIVFLISIPPALLLRRSRPLLALFIGFVPNLAYGAAIAAAEDVFGGLSVGVVILVVPYALYRWGSGRAGMIGGAALVATGVIGNATNPDSTGGDWIGSFVVLAIPVLAGLAMRYRGVARERTKAQIASLEREQLARELHDSVAHHVSAIAIQARAGRAVAAADPDRAIAVLGVIEDAAARSLAELRTLVVALRADEGADLAPQRGLADLAALAEHAPPGLPVSVTVDPALGALASTVETTIHRIARESVTNAARHAHGATGVWIDVAAHGDEVRLTVHDDGRPSGAPAADDGRYGIRGMTERAALIGGRLRAGPAPERGWTVTADLPRVPAATAGRRP